MREDMLRESPCSDGSQNRILDAAFLLLVRLGQFNGKREKCWGLVKLEQRLAECLIVFSANRPTQMF